MGSASEDRMLIVRRATTSDVGRLSTMLKASWQAAYGHIPGFDPNHGIGYLAASQLQNWVRIQSAAFAPHRVTSLVATVGDKIVGHAFASFGDDSQIILFMLYVHPDRQGLGIGTLLVDCVIAAHPMARAVRLEVLKQNAREISWYERRGFATYGETPNATETRGVAAYYMDKRLEPRHSPLVESNSWLRGQDDLWKPLATLDLRDFRSPWSRA